MSALVVSLCDRTGNMVLPWLEAGYRALTVDLQPSELNHPHHVHLQQDVRVLARVGLAHNFPIAMCFAFPPCTDLASSGARWFKQKGMRSLIDALETVEQCRLICEQSNAPWMLENPVGVLSTFWCEPDYAFDPCDYGDPYTKQTWVWCGNGFVMPPKIDANDMFAAATRVPPTEGSKFHTMSRCADRADVRSATPMGFSRAVFLANSAKSAQNCAA